VARTCSRTSLQLGLGHARGRVYGKRLGSGDPFAPYAGRCGAWADPGNFGTALRSAVAFGAASVALGPGTADPYGPKAVRASMGAIFDVPVVRASNIGELPGHKVALAARSGRTLAEVGPREAITLVVGAEREGLSDGVLASCNETAHIPIRSESLNAAMAATIGLYELTRVARA
jgi:TrmH family RNA methyltransferase